MENGMLVLFQVGQLPVTAYALALTVILAVSLTLFLDLCRKRGIEMERGFRFAVLALPLGLIFARLMYGLCRISLYSEVGYAEILRCWHGGYALWGAIGGVVLAAFLAGGKGMLKLMDAAAAPAALAIGLGRLAEIFNGEGIGMLVENEALCFFPLAVQNEFGEWYYAVFMLEAVAALVIFAVLMKKCNPEGWGTKAFFFLFCTCSLLLESLRRDQFLRWLFVRVNQLTAVLVLTGMLVYALVRWVRNPSLRRMGKGAVAGCWAGFVLLAGGCIALEFAVDKAAWLPVWACYSLMTLFVAAMGLCAGKLLFQSVAKANEMPIEA